LPAWRLISEGFATLEELETRWSLDDVAKANAVLDYRAAQEEAARKEAEARRG
jgi:hypothetical protein